MDTLVLHVGGTCTYLFSGGGVFRTLVKYHLLNCPLSRIIIVFKTPNAVLQY
jgi:hypothetical protein